MSSLPPLPPGFKLDAPAQQELPPLPPGFTLDQPAQGAADPRAGDDLLSDESMTRLAAGEGSSVTPTREPSLLDRASRYAGEYFGGIGRALGGPASPPTMAEQIVPGYGLAESAMTLVSGIAAPVLGSIEAMALGGDPDEAMRRHVYEPRSQAAKSVLGLASAVAKPAADVAEKTGADVALLPLAAGRLTSPYETQALRGARDARALKAASKQASAKPRSAEDVVASLSTDSAGASAAAADLSNASPELREAIVATARKTGGAVNPQVLARHLEADSLPVRIRLSEGQATGDPELISREMNMRGKQPEFVARLDEQNKGLAENMRVLREESGPEVFSTNAVEHGDALIAAYKAKHQAAQAAIDAKYQALRNAAGGELPIDTRSLWSDLSGRLKKELLFEHAPKSVMVQLKNMAQSGMNFEQFEALRTNLATIQRSHTLNGLERRAAGVIRQALEDMPLQPRAADLKGLADDARKAARSQFATLEADPAYSAAVEDAVPADRFVQRFLVGAPRQQVERMRTNLGDNETAVQTMGVSVLDHLRDQARLSPNYEGNFAAASFDKSLKQLSPKLRHILPAGTTEQLEKLGNVARYTTAQPRGAFVNNSNTFVAQAADYGVSALEGAANVAAQGVPVGTWGRRALTALQSGRTARRAMAPGAGLGRLAAPKAGPQRNPAAAISPPAATPAASRDEPSAVSNRFAQLAGDDFDTERAAAAEASRGGYEVEELPASAVREITLETQPNRLQQLEPQSVRNAARTAVATRSQSSPSVSQIQTEMRSLERRAASLPSDSPELLEIDARYQTLQEELALAKKRKGRNRIAQLAGDE